MTKQKCIAFAMLLLPLIHQLMGQKPGSDKELDSLIAAAAAMPDDTFKAKTLDKLAYRASFSNPEQGLALAQQLLELSEKLDWPKGVALAHVDMGVNYNHLSRYELSIQHYKTALAYYRKSGKRSAESGMLSNISIVYKTQGKYEKALEFALEALKIQESINRPKDKAIVLENIGTLYLEEKDYTSTAQYYEKARAIYLRLKDTAGIARNLMNTGIMLDGNKRYAEALRLHQQAYAYVHNTNNLKALQLVCANLGIVHSHLKQFVQAEAYHLKSLELSRRMGNRGNEAIDLGNLGETYLEKYKANPQIKGAQDLLKNAISHLEQAMAICREINFPGPLKAFGYTLAEAYEAHGNYKNALAVFKTTEQLNDSMNSVGHYRAMARLESREAMEKKERELHIKRNEARLAVLEAGQLRNLSIIYILATCLAALGLVLVFLLYRQRSRKHRSAMLEISQIQSHQLRAPVAKIQAVVDAIEDAPEHSHEKQRMLEYLKRSAAELDNIIHGIVDRASKQH